MKVFKSEDVRVQCCDDFGYWNTLPNTLVIADAPRGSRLLIKQPPDKWTGSKDNGYFSYDSHWKCIELDSLTAPSPDDEAFEREWEKYRNLPPGPPRTMTKDTAKYFWDKRKEIG